MELPVGGTERTEAIKRERERRRATSWQKLTKPRSNLLRSLYKPNIHTGMHVMAFGPASTMSVSGKEG
jgi:hypothetical protein